MNTLRLEWVTRGGMAISGLLRPWLDYISIILGVVPISPVSYLTSVTSCHHPTLIRYFSCSIKIWKIYIITGLFPWKEFSQLQTANIINIHTHPPSPASSFIPSICSWSPPWCSHLQFSLIIVLLKSKWTWLSHGHITQLHKRNTCPSHPPTINHTHKQNILSV